MSLCEFVFTIEPRAHPELAIGDRALHHWNRETDEIAIGGSLLPEYWGRGMMQAAFELLTEIARQKLGVRTLVGQTKSRNHKAIRLFQKMGFATHLIEGDDIILRKEL